MPNPIRLFLLALALCSCDDPIVTRGPGTETETVQTWVREGATDGLRPLAGTLVRQVARLDWQSRIDRKLSVVLDSAWTDSLGRCRFARREGAAYEAVRSDSLLGWDTSSGIILRKPAIWTGKGVPGRSIRLRGTTISRVVDGDGGWGLAVPQGTFEAVSTGPDGSVELGARTFASGASDWDTTRNLGNSVLLSGTGMITGRWHLSWLDGQEPYADPPSFTDADTCRSGCPILATGAPPLPSPDRKPYGMGLEILVYGRRVRVLEADHIRIRFYSTTLGISAFVQPGSPRTWASSSPQTVSSPADGSVTSEFTVGVGPGQILGGFVLMADRNSGQVIVKEVLLESTTGVRIALE